MVVYYIIVKCLIVKKKFEQRFDFKYINFHGFCFYIPNKILNFYLIQCDTMKRRRFNVRITIKMKIGDIKIKFMKVDIF